MDMERHIIDLPVHIPAPALDQLAMLFGPLSDAQIRCVLRFEGRLDAERLARAFRLCLDAEPVSGCRLVRGRGQVAWERCTDLDERVLCAMTTYADPHTYAQELQHFLVAPLAIDAGPAATACLLRGATDTLIVKLHHFAADGFGLLQFVLTLTAMYRALDDNPRYRPEPNDADRGQGLVLRRVGPIGMLGALAALRPAARTAHWGTIATNAERADRRFALRRINPDHLQALRLWGRAQGVSMNDILLTALYRALCSALGTTGPGPLSIGVPIDLRRYLDPGTPLPVGNLSNSADVVIAAPPDASFAATLRRVHSAMRAVKTTGRGLRLAVLAELLALPMSAVGRTALEQVVRRIPPTSGCAPFFSNIGVINEQAVDFGGIRLAETYGLGPVNFPPGLLITASTFRDVLTIAIGFCATATDPTLIDRLLDAMVEALPG